MELLISLTMVERAGISKKDLKGHEDPEPMTEG